jgi:RNA polymerase sigma-70 factor (ECF subfamily)
VNAAAAAAERAARLSYGRLVALLALRTRDVAEAEDALAEAFRMAIETWPSAGVPHSPDAWLLTVARRSAGRAARHRAVRSAARPTIELLLAEETRPEAIPDERLRLLFACAHPALDPAVRAPLMLQVVLGLDAARIAACFLASPAAMGQRLGRAKARIREARIPFAVPETSELAPRLDAVLEAIYAAYGTGWEDVTGEDPKRRGLSEEATWLARLVVGLLPAEPEARGLLALMLHGSARRAARRDAAGAFVPLSRQDPALWEAAAIAEAEAEILAAAAMGRPGRFQIEAAIQSLHVQAARSGHGNPGALLALYDLLARLSPTAGVLVARAAALAEAGLAEAALAALDAIAGDTGGYQPFWAARGDVLARLGRGAEAADAFRRAAGMAADPAVRAFLLARAAGCRAA